MPSYLDHNAASPMHAPVIGAMPAYPGKIPAEPSNLRGCGLGSRRALIAGGEGRQGRQGGIEYEAGPGKTVPLIRLEIEERKLHLEQLRYGWSQISAGLVRRTAA